MARLNEAAMPVKRRFIRQNRDIARVNSAQASRIRSLEAETSRLLSENIALRGENIQLKQELEEGRSRRTLDHVYNLKEQMQAKVKEISDLLGGLGKTPKLTLRTTPKRPNERSSVQRSPNQKEWKTSASLAEVAGDGRLPPILEDKHYPRRTLEMAELQHIASDGGDYTDSPDLDPPVAHLIDVDSAAPETGTQPSSPSPENPVQQALERSDPDPLAFANLETRRKRRESNAPPISAQIEDAHELSQDDAQACVLQQPLKVGAKRKLSSREDIGGSKSHSTELKGKAIDKSLKGAEEAPTKPGADRQPNATRATPSQPKSTARTASDVAARKVLGEKPVNTDPMVSPAKSRIKPAGTSKPPTKNVSAHPCKPGFRPSSTSNGGPMDVASLKAHEWPEVAVAGNEHPPKTPAPVELDIFSPTDTQPSITRIEASRDTPPPADLHSAGDVGRPSRRQRAAVSYAEPNLRDKMRRPTKELTDAVGSESRTARGSSVKAESMERDFPTREKGSTAKVKSEVDPIASNSQAWKDLPRGLPAGTDVQAPASPLRDKGIDAAEPTEGGTLSAPDLPSTVQMERRRRSSSASNATLAAVMAGSSQRIFRAREAAEAARAHQADKSSLSNPSTTRAGDAAPASGPDGAGPKEDRAARRHSSMANLRSNKAHEGGGQSVLGKRGGSSLRRSTMTSGARENAKRDTQTSADRGGGPSWAPDRGSAELDGDTEADAPAPSDRMSTRRRSMMI